MPRSPNEGAQTRRASEIDRTLRAQTPVQDRRVRSGADRRMRDMGPPDGVERRRGARRAADRRSQHGIDRRGSGNTDRRRQQRRSSMSRRGPGAGLGGRSPRAADAPLPPRRNAPVVLTRTDRVLRGLLIVVIAIGCLLAATLPLDVFATLSAPR